MDRIGEALRELSLKERTLFKQIFGRVLSKDFASLDIKKLRGHDDIYRVRKGNLRVIYRIQKEAITVLALERRSDTTYHRF